MSRTADPRISEASAALEAGVQAIIESADFQRILAMVGTFHRYSLQNTLLIWTQRPDASHVAGFKTWLSCGRSVRKGEKGIRIFVPRVHKDKDAGEDDQQQAFVTFAIGHVFDISQTDGDPLPDGPIPVLPSCDVAAGFTAAALAFASARSIPVDMAHAGYVESPVRGSWSPSSRSILVAADATPIEGAKTLVHELAHALTPDGFADRDQREAIAEGAAFVVCDHFGMATGDYSFPYVAGYCTDGDRFRATLGTVQAIAHQLIDGITAGL